MCQALCGETQVEMICMVSILILVGETAEKQLQKQKR